MAVNVFGGGPVQPSLVSYRFIDLTADLTLFWPTSYLDTGDVVAANMNVTNLAATDFSIMMPDATQVGVGMQCVFTNIGNSNFSIKTSTGALIRTAVPGTSYYLYLTDRSTIGGTWTSLVYGGTTSSASAADLAGFGLVALPRPGDIASLNTDIKTVSTNDITFNPTIDNRSNLIVWTGGADDITLPALTPTDVGYYVSFNNQGSGLWRIIPTPPALFDGLTDIEVNFGQSLTAVFDGNDWYSLGFGQDLIFPFTVLNKNISGNTNVTLTIDEGANEVLQFNHGAGALTGDVIVFMPSRVQFQWVVYNNTTGAFNLSIQQTNGAGGGTGTIYTIPQGNRQTFYSDGTILYNFPTVVEISNTVTFPDGTLAAPGIAFTNSPSTGIGSPGLNEISIVAGAIEAIHSTSTAINLLHNTAVTGALSVTDRTTTFDNIAPAAPLTGSVLTYDGTRWISIPPNRKNEILLGSLTGASDWGGIPTVQQRSAVQNAASAGLTNAAFVTVVGMTKDIVPTAINSKILIMVTVNIKSDQIGYLQLVRDATPIGIGTGGAPNVGTSFGVSTGFVPYTFTFIDSPASAVSMTYSLQAYVTGGGTYFINTDATAIGSSTFYLFELGGY